MDVTDPVIYIRVFDSVGALPNTFAIDSSRINSEFRLLGEKGSVYIGEGSIEQKLEFMRYLEKEKRVQYKVCGVDVIKGGTEELEFQVAYDENNYLFFAGVDESVVSSFFKVLCEVKGSKGKGSEYPSDKDHEDSGHSTQSQSLPKRN